MTPRKLTQQYVKDLFDYHDGFLYWKRKRGCRTAGDEAGSIRLDSNSMRVRIDYRNIEYARVVFVWHHGYLPAQVRHKDGNTMNNKIENLEPFGDDVLKKRKTQMHKDLAIVLERKQLKKAKGK